MKLVRKYQFQINQASQIKLEDKKEFHEKVKFQCSVVRGFK